ncbi:hypothetical protein MFIFM68171_09562 [Madurella fahalii]|uniref:Uncharacterized protein n=1 Tax=Madurella fahalii TaxID=1157608 RepID=A0ABQ0GNJ9_9PEZI
MDFLPDQKPIAPTPYPPSHITPTSPFLPHNRHCSISSPSSPQPSPQATLGPAEPCACLPHYSLPVSWLCGTCGAAQSVLEMLLLTQQHQHEYQHQHQHQHQQQHQHQHQHQQRQQRLGDVEGRAGACGGCCERPSLRAVYDQFGRIFLCWRDDDPAVSDLRDPDKVREAARRVWQAGGGEVLDLGMGMGRGGEGSGGDMMEAEEAAERGWARLSRQSSVTSEDSFDGELAAMEE